MTIGTLKARLAKMDLRFIATESIDQTKDHVKLLQQAQLFEGMTSEEHPIHRIGKPPDYIYAERTIREKRIKGQPTNRVTLRDKRDFYNEIFVDARDETFVIDSADEKAGKLIMDYGEKIFGLGRSRRAEWVQETLKPTYVRNIKTATGL